MHNVDKDVKKQLEFYPQLGITILLRINRPLFRKNSIINIMTNRLGKNSEYQNYCGR